MNDLHQGRTLQNRIKNRGLNHPIHDPEFVRRWYGASEGDAYGKHYALCRHCGDELNAVDRAGDWRGYDGRFCDEAQTQRHEPMPRPEQTSSEADLPPLW